MEHFCLLCMQHHPRQVVTLVEQEADGVSYSAEYEYCPEANEHLETEEMMTKNAAAYKAAQNSSDTKEGNR